MPLINDELLCWIQRIQRLKVLTRHRAQGARLDKMADVDLFMFKGGVWEFNYTKNGMR